MRRINEIIIKVNKKLVLRLFYIFTLTLLLFIISWGYKAAIKMMYPLDHEDIVLKNSLKYNVEKELIFAIIKCESGFDKKAHSHAGAHGLMQLTPETFNWLKECYTHDENNFDSELENPEVNISYGTLLVSILLKKYKNEDLVLSAYNAGIAATDRWLSDKRFSKDGITLSYIPYKETRNYVEKVKRVKSIYKNLYFKK